MDLTDKELHEMYVNSKDDRVIWVGSEIRQLIGMIQRLKLALAQEQSNALPR